MVIDQKYALALAQQELYFKPCIELLGRGFLGKHIECRAGLSSKPCSIARLNAANIGSYFSGVTGWFNNCSFGNYCTVSEGVKTLNDHDVERITTSACTVKVDCGYPNYKDFKGQKRFIASYHVYVGHDVWIGSDVQIMGGVIIGSGAVIEDGSIVTKHVPPFAIVGGAPAKLIKMRFSDTEIERILKSAWYTYDWNNIELDWGNRQNCLSQMEDLIAAGKVPLLKDGYVYEATNNNLLMAPHEMTLNQLFKAYMGINSFEEFFALKTTQEHLIK